MILAIDIGNTNIVLGCMEHDRILVEARMATDVGYSVFRVGPLFHRQV